MASNSTRVTIGVHPNNQSLFVLRRLGVLEDSLDAHGAEVEWVDYDDGRCTIDLFAEGEIDFGGTGSMPPIQAQSDGLPIGYVAASPPRPAQGAVIVHEDSPVRSLSDLRGRSVALMEGSYHTELLAFALLRAGLSYTDVETVDGLAHENRADFLSGRAQAWVAGDPYLAQVQTEGTGVRYLAGTAEHIPNRSFWWARNEFARDAPDLLDTVVDALARAEEWIVARPAAAAALFSEALPESPSAASWERSLRRRPWGHLPVHGDPAREQQAAADLYARLGIIPAPISVNDALLPTVASLRKAV